MPLHDDPNIRNFLLALISKANKTFFSEGLALPVALSPHEWSIQMNGNLFLECRSKPLDSSALAPYHRILESLAGQMDGFSVFKEPYPNYEFPEKNNKLVISVTEVTLRRILVENLRDDLKQFISERRPDLGIERNNSYLKVVVLLGSEMNLYFISKDDTGRVSHFFDMKLTEFEQLRWEMGMVAAAPNPTTNVVTDAVSTVVPRLPAYDVAIQRDELPQLPNGAVMSPSQALARYQQLTLELDALRAHLPPAPPYSDRPAPGQ